jgi:hypothetical protein
VKTAGLILIAVAVSMIALFPFKITNAMAEDNGYSVTSVNHVVTAMFNGYILINDTVQIAGQVPNSFLIGFPYKYGSQVMKCMAYNSTDIFSVSLGVPFENSIGFYGAEISSSQGLPQLFNVVFVLSNNLLNGSATGYALDFPAYPSLFEDTNCSVTLVLPQGVTNVTVTKDDGVVYGFTYAREVPALTYMPATLTFSLTGETMHLFDITELDREVSINGIGEIEGSDSYSITSKSSDNINTVEVTLPPNASGPNAEDQFGRSMSAPSPVSQETNTYSVSFTLPLESLESTRFTVKYDLSSQEYVETQGGVSNFNVSPLLFQYVNYYVEQASVNLVLPEGARALNPENTLIGTAYSITRSVFQETLSINRQDVSLLESAIPSENVLQVEYQYDPLWLSFRPTLWVWALATVVCAFGVVWKRPQAPAEVAVPSAVVRLRPDHVKSFVDAYEEKRRISAELESLESRVRKGKMPRRRYKVQRVTLETRLNTLSRNLTGLEERMRAAGGMYENIMRQLEIAETEIKEGEVNIRSIEARQSRGELSYEAYRKLLSDYQRRKEKAETTINGILLRLREEIH